MPNPWTTAHPSHSVFIQLCAGHDQKDTKRESIERFTEVQKAQVLAHCPTWFCPFPPSKLCKSLWQVASVECTLKFLRLRKLKFSPKQIKVGLSFPSGDIQAGDDSSRVLQHGSAVCGAQGTDTRRGTEGRELCLLTVPRVSTKMRASLTIVFRE